MSTYYLHNNGFLSQTANCVVEGAYCKPRPVVVIDPEDREQMERLRDLFDAAVIRQNDDPDPRDVTPGARADALQAAFREIASPKPSKPDEPTARWAVVVDRDDEEWVRILGPDFADAWARAGSLPSNGTWTVYADIDAVRVLSEGV